MKHSSNQPDNVMERLVSLCKRRGFVFPSSELYGGLGGFYDYGPLGVELKRNIEQAWWSEIVQKRSDIVGMESSVIMNPRVWKASGHLKSFTDPLVECKVCHERFRADLKEEIAGHKHQGKFTEARDFQMMFQTSVGSVQDDSSTAYLRPELAQGMFVNFENILSSTNLRVPFGIAQIGRSFRNEITFRNFLFRQREFTIAELEYFVKPGDDDKAFDDWLEFQQKISTDVFGLKKEHLKLYEHPKSSLAHYSKRTIDTHYKFPWGWDELWGISNRIDFDLKQHEKESGKEIVYRDPVTGEKFRPYVIEPTLGIDRLFLAMLVEGYTSVEGGRSTTKESIKEEEVVLKLPKSLAPIKVAVLPLSKKPELQKIAESVAQTLRSKFTVMYDETASIGKRYRRQDEIGTPYCVTVDFDSVGDKKVTVRDRDSMQQERLKIDELTDYLRNQLR